ncbi:hypothetical protein ACHAWF_004371 [Thalassiosira exigua]
MVNKPKKLFATLLPCAGLFDGAYGFLPAARRTLVPPALLSSPTSEGTDVSKSLGGVADFEEWFSSNSSSGARANHVRHAVFNTMGRGLQFTSTKSSDLKSVAVVPRKLVLNAPYSDEEDSSSGRSWDTNLSCKLWEECQKGRDSPYHGYCSLLTRGANVSGPGASSYPSTAPNALRHWTTEQKSWLDSEKGERLVGVEREQQEEWRRKYDSLGASEKESMTYDDFQWAMEAVHSRAFRGDFGALDGGEGGPLRKIASLLLPLSALAFGIIYATDRSFDKYFVPLGIVAALPVVLTIIADQKGSKEAVMLPLIDSANHLQEADSVIEYDPSLDSFVLSLGKKCLVKEVDEDGERAQVCISYGVRKDSELLLNYGFLRGVSIGGLDESTDRSRDNVRRRLAEAFLKRNP